MMTGTGYAKSQRGEEEEKEEGKVTQEEAVPAPKRPEKKEEKKKVPPKGPPPVAMVDASHLGGMVNIDATDQIAGRLCSKVAKLILVGKRVTVVNAERALISGARNSVIRQWMERLEIASRVNPIYGPIHPRRPDTILRRMVRGMVPRRKPKGAAAMKRLRIYIGVPEEMKAMNFARFEDAQATRPIPVYITVKELSKNLGWSE